MNPDQQAVQKILELASSWAESGHTGLQRTLGLLNVGRIGVEEAVKKAGRDLTVLAEAGADLRAKGLKAEETVRRVNNIAAIRAQKALAELAEPVPQGNVASSIGKAKELTNKIITSKPVAGLRGNRMAMAALAGLGGAASGATLASLLNGETKEDL
tara:strand:+ start:440 stop:910 length:471 start_codon:yes stop_codon:yes gene_type:complete